MSDASVIATASTRRPRRAMRAAGLFVIWLLLLIFIVYPLAMKIRPRGRVADGRY